MNSQRKLLLRIPRRALVMFAGEKHQDVTDNRVVQNYMDCDRSPSTGLQP